eukprot:CFRG0480T1
MFDYKCYPERYTLNAVPEAPEPPVYFDAIFLSPSALTDSQNQPTYYANLYASIARKICILRHTILRDNNSAHNCTEVEDAQLYPIDVCMYMMRSNRFASAQSCRERSKNQRNQLLDFGYEELSEDLTTTISTDTVETLKRKYA